MHDLAAIYPETSAPRSSFPRIFCTHERKRCKPTVSGKTLAIRPGESLGLSASPRKQGHKYTVFTFKVERDTYLSRTEQTKCICMRGVTKTDIPLAMQPVKTGLSQHSSAWKASHCIAVVLVDYLVQVIGYNTQELQIPFQPGWSWHQTVCCAVLQMRLERIWSRQK